MSINVEMSEAREEKKNVTVRIFGSDYPITGVKDPQQVEELARYLDARMNEIAKGSALLSSGKVAVLAALNLAEELFRLRASHQKLRASALAGMAEIAKKIDTHFQK